MTSIKSVFYGKSKLDRLLVISVATSFVCLNIGCYTGYKAGVLLGNYCSLHSECLNKMLEKTWNSEGFYGRNNRKVDVQVCELDGSSVKDAYLVFNYESLFPLYSGFMPTSLRIMKDNGSGRIVGTMSSDCFIDECNTFREQPAVIVAPGRIPVVFRGQDRVFMLPRTIIPGLSRISRRGNSFLYDRERNRLLPLAVHVMPISRRWHTMKEFEARKDVLVHYFGGVLAEDENDAWLFAVDDRLLQCALRTFGDSIVTNRQVQDYFWMNIPNKDVLLERCTDGRLTMPCSVELNGDSLQNDGLQKRRE